MNFERSTVLFLSDHFPFENTNSHHIWGDEHLDHKALGSSLSKIFKNVLYGNSCEDIIRHFENIDFVISWVGNGTDEEPWKPIDNQWFKSAGICEVLNIPSLGIQSSTLMANADKHIQKTFLAGIGVPTPRWIKLGDNQSFSSIGGLKYPAIVKWRLGMNSFFIEDETVVKNDHEAAAQVEKLRKNVNEVIIEEFIEGKNLTVGVIGGKQPLVGDVVEIHTPSAFNLQTFSMKFQDATTRKKTIFTDEKIKKQIEQQVRKIAKFYNPFDFMRIDLRYNDKEDELFVIENNVPSNFEEGGSFHLSMSSQFPTYEELLIKLLNATVERYETNNVNSWNRTNL